MDNDELKELEEDTNDEELNYANELDLQKELYDLNKLKKELNGLEKKSFLNVKIFNWYEKYFEISKKTNINQHNYYVEETNKFFKNRSKNEPKWKRISKRNIF